MYGAKKHLLSRALDVCKLNSSKRRFAIGQALWGLALFALAYWFWDYNARAPGLFKGVSWVDEDPMAFSGFLTVIIGISYSVLVDRSQAAVVSSWHELAIFEIDAAVKDRVEHELFKNSFWWQCSIGLLVLLVMISGYASVFTLSGLLSEFSLASFICGLLVGMRLGRLASHGFLGRTLERHQAKFHIFVEHPDLTGGTAKVGVFYLLQASVVIIPISWLFLWIYFAPRYPNYAIWEEHFVHLLFLGFFVFLLTFLLPMRSFRRLIKEWKQRYLRQEIKAVRRELHQLSSITFSDAKQHERRRALAHYLHQLSSLPSFPISPLTRNVFITTLILPMVVNVATNLIK